MSLIVGHINRVLFTLDNDELVTNDNQNRRKRSLDSFLEVQKTINEICINITTKMCKRGLFPTWVKAVNNDISKTVDKLIASISNINSTVVDIENIRRTVLLCKQIRSTLERLNAMFVTVDRHLHYNEFEAVFTILDTELLPYLSHLQPLVNQFEKNCKEILNLLS